MKRKALVSWGFLLLLLLVLSGTIGCRSGTPQDQKSTASGPPGTGVTASVQKVKVVVTFYPIEYLVSRIGGDRTEVTSLVPNGVEPHDWEPKVTDLKTLNRARVFVYNGAGFEPWVNKVLKSLDNKSLIAVDSSQGIELLKGQEDDHEGHGHKEPSHKESGHKEPGHKGETDPHIWLDPNNTIYQANLVLKALIEADPAGRAFYEANAQGLIEELRVLDQEYRTLASCANREIVISHAFFAYPAKRYGLELISIARGLSPEAEPTPKQMAEIIKTVREKKLKFVFIEPLVSDKLAKTIASETGAGILTLNPLEGLTAEERAQGKDLISLMRENLKNLKIALDCH